MTHIVVMDLVLYSNILNRTAKKKKNVLFPLYPSMMTMVINLGDNVQIDKIQILIIWVY